MKSVVITGTSTGIGYASSKLFIENGYRVFGSVRNKKNINFKNSLVTGNIFKNNKLNIDKIIYFVKKNKIKFIINCLGVTKHRSFKTLKRQSYHLNSKI